MRKDVQSHTINGIRWLVNSTSFDGLPGLLDSIVMGRDCEVIRTGYFKKIVRYTANQHSFYLKQYTTHRPMDAVKSLCAVSKARKEWNCAHLLLDKHLRTAEPVAVGEKRRFGILKDCYIISKAIPNGATVRELLGELQKSSACLSAKDSLLKNLISYVKTVHNLGVFHGELHAENIMADRDNTAVFYLLDVGRAVFRRDSPQSLRIKELSRLLYSFMDACTNEEITGCINQYAAQTAASGDREAFRSAVLKGIYRIKQRLWDSRTRKCLKNNNAFRVATHRNYAIHMRREWDVHTLLTLIEKHALALRKGAETVIKASHKIAITSVPVFSEGMKSVCIKEFKYASSLKKYLYFCCGSPARKAWLAAHGLLALNIRTPKPVALLEKNTFARIDRSFIVMEDISDCLPCNKYVSERCHNSCDTAAFRRKEKFLSHLARSFKQLHDSNVYHADLKANNIMVMELADTWNFFYLDLDRVYFNKKITRKKMIKNLSQINASLPGCITFADRLRFFHTYTGMKKFDGGHKQLIREIIRFSIQRKHVWNPTVKP